MFVHDYTCWRTFSLNSLTAHDFISSPHLTSVEGCGCVSARRARRKKRNHFPVVQPCLRLLLREQQTEARQVNSSSSPHALSLVPPPIFPITRVKKKEKKKSHFHLILYFLTPSQPSFFLPFIGDGGQQWDAAPTSRLYTHLHICECPSVSSFFSLTAPLLGLFHL